MKLIVIISCIYACDSHAEEEERIEYEYNRQTSTITFFDVIPSAKCIDAVSVEELGCKFDECSELYVKYSIDNFKYCYSTKDSSHTISNLESSKIKHFMQLPFPFDVIVIPRDSPVVSDKVAADAKLKMVIALEAIKESDNDTQVAIYQDILSELKMSPTANFHYVQFILNRWFSSGLLSPIDFKNLTLANKFLHDKVYEDVAFFFHPHDYGLSDEDYLALLQLQQDRIVWGGANSRCCVFRHVSFSTL